MPNEKDTEKYCSDERPCINCFSDQYSMEPQECLNKPMPTGCEETQTEKSASVNSYDEYYPRIMQGEFLLKVAESSASKEVITLAETKLKELLGQF